MANADWDAAATIAAMDALAGRMRVATIGAVQRGGMVMVALMQDLAPVKSGTLRRSIFADPVVEIGPDTWMTQVAPHVVYGRIQDLGGTIFPKARLVVGRNGKIYAHVLSWVGDDGLRHFAHRVTLRGSFYAERAVAASAPRIARIAYEAWAGAIVGS